MKCRLCTTNPTEQVVDLGFVFALNVVNGTLQGSPHIVQLIVIKTGAVCISFNSMRQV
jgi:hypothetical protein